MRQSSPSSDETRGVRGAWCERRARARARGVSAVADVYGVGGQGARCGTCARACVKQQAGGREAVAAGLGDAVCPVATGRANRKEMWARRKAKGTPCVGGREPGAGRGRRVSGGCALNESFKGKQFGACH